ncbi:MAG TPA: prepilin-type N-terminal cleavage/methylation domain-containing protein [Gemmatimonadaceae bacterium]|jgi:prepilin-type N-terminal cleavage/methylation domain
MMTIRRSRASWRQQASQRRRDGRQGFTLIELIVAIVIMVVGVLGLASTAAMVSRMVGGAGQQTVAANVATSRFEQLHSVPCAQIVGGAAETRHTRERWHAEIDPLSPSLYVVTDTVTYDAAGGRSPQLVFQSYIRCP